MKYNKKLLLTLVLILICLSFLGTYLFASNNTQDESGIQVAVYKNSKNTIYGYIISGHSGYAEKGSDIICAGVSSLSFTTLGSIMEYTKDKVDYQQDDSGYLKFMLPNLKKGKGSKEAIVLLKALLYGLKGVQAQYGEKYLKIKVVK